MLTKTAMITVRVNPVVKKEIERVFQELGISTSDAINLFFNQIRLCKKFPFEIGIPEERQKEMVKKQRAK